ncbi:MAG: class I SAM-dependent methyltransferase [Chitinophagaceae bacterium]|nr:class I SAM-dependent methyltransferase [Chitinophagaceae bacterium]
MADRNAETEKIINLWVEGGSDFAYYEKADSADWVNGFWNEDSLFARNFSQLNTEFTLEIACGAGRHSERFIDNTKHIWLLDTSEAGLALAEKRLSPRSNFTTVHHPSGYGIPDIIQPESLTAVFSYDAMVHFEYDCVIAYVNDSYKALKPGGMALFHHSNYDKNPGGTIDQNPSWRNFMSQSFFKHIAKRAGFNVIGSYVFPWVNTEITDCLTLLKK